MKEKNTDSVSFFRRIPFLKRMDEVTIENDIRYRGPLSYRHLRILAWLFLVGSQGYILYTREQIFIGNTEPQNGSLILSSLSYFVMPLFLIAVYAIMLDGRERYKQMFMIYIPAAIGLAALFYLIVDRYIVGVINSVNGNNTQKSKELVYSVLDNKTYGTGHFEFNIFIDMVLCVAFLYFINHTPKKVFTGRKIIIFRLFALIPILYEVASNTLKICASIGVIKLPIEVFPFLTTKPPMMFLMFIVLVYVMKKRERIYLRRGKTHHDYNEFLKTNTNSFQFSLILVLLFIIFALLDHILLNILQSIFTSGIPDDGSIESITEQLKWYNNISSWGFGELHIMLWLSPFMLLFSYTRKHRHVIVDMAIPLVGIVLFIIVELEYIYHIICDLAGGLISFGQ